MLSAERCSVILLARRVTNDGHRWRYSFCSSILFRDISPLGSQRCISIEADFIICSDILPGAVGIVQAIAGKLPYRTVGVISQIVKHVRSENCLVSIGISGFRHHSVMTAAVVPKGMNIIIDSPAGDVQCAVAADTPGGNILAVDGDASALRTGYIGKEQRDRRGAELRHRRGKQASLAWGILSSDQRNIIDIEAIQRRQPDADLPITVQEVNQAVFITDLLIVPAYIAHAAHRDLFSV